MNYYVVQFVCFYSVEGAGEGELTFFVTERSASAIFRYRRTNIRQLNRSSRSREGWTIMRRGCEVASAGCAVVGGIGYLSSRGAQRRREASRCSAAGGARR